MSAPLKSAGPNSDQKFWIQHFGLQFRDELPSDVSDILRRIDRKYDTRFGAGHLGGDAYTSIQEVQNALLAIHSGDIDWREVFYEVMIDHDGSRVYQFVKEKDRDGRIINKAYAIEILEGAIEVMRTKADQITWFQHTWARNAVPFQDAKKSLVKAMDFLASLVFDRR